MDCKIKLEGTIYDHKFRMNIDTENTTHTNITTAELNKNAAYYNISSVDVECHKSETDTTFSFQSSEISLLEVDDIPIAVDTRTGYYYEDTDMRNLTYLLMLYTAPSSKVLFPTITAIHGKNSIKHIIKGILSGIIISDIDTAVNKIMYSTTLYYGVIAKYLDYNKDENTFKLKQYDHKEYVDNIYARVLYDIASNMDAITIDTNTTFNVKRVDMHIRTYIINEILGVLSNNTIPQRTPVLRNYYSDSYKAIESLLTNTEQIYTDLAGIVKLHTYSNDKKSIVQTLIYILNKYQLYGIDMEQIILYIKEHHQHILGVIQSTFITISKNTLNHIMEDLHILIDILSKIYMISEETYGFTKESKLRLKKFFKERR